MDADGAAKLLVVSRTLRLRRDRPELFGGYRPVPARGPAAAHAVAFDRGGAVAVATRLPLRLARSGGWRRHGAVTSRSRAGPTCSPDGSTVVLSCSVDDLLSTYPVALLAPTDSVEAAA